MNARIGGTGVGAAYLAKLWTAALTGAAAAWAVKLAIGPRHPVLAAALILAPFGGLYLAITAMFGIRVLRRAVALLTDFRRGW